MRFFCLLMMLSKPCHPLIKWQSSFINTTAEKVMNRIPNQLMKFYQSGVGMADLISSRQHYDDNDYPWAKRMLGKFPIPVWQRDSVWTLDQKVSFIESAFLGYDLGSIVINGYLDGKNDTLVMYSDCLIDGQQRIEASLDFVNNKFKVYGLYWKELTRSEQNRFLMRELGKRMVDCFDEVKLKEVYNHLNFSGTSHKESERA